MGRQQVSLMIDAEALRTAVSGRETFSAIAQKYGVTRQAVNQWLTEGRIPPRALCEIVSDLRLSVEQVQAILAPQMDKNREKKKWTVTLTVEES